MSLLQHRWLRRDMEKYRGRLCGCAPGTHQRLVKMLLAHVPGPHAAVVDLGAGTGALLLRLQDAGFTDLEGADMAEANWSVPAIPYTRVDLNGSFASAFRRKFRIACLSEVIEHLDSPRHALVQARLLLEDGGYLAVTTPNVGFWEGRLKFALTGELWGFGETSYRAARHISPITREQMALALREIGFKLIAFATAGSFATALRQTLSAPLWLPMAAIAGRSVLGECAFFLAQKAPPDLELAMPTDYRTAWAGGSDGPTPVHAGADHRRG